ncbi:MAG: DUF3857 domain-containing protein [Gemmatimonadales bacterium]|nr:DUF3857 domain-containing protein [Gemmatimonadales bacterium]
MLSIRWSFLVLICLLAGTSSLTASAAPVDIPAALKAAGSGDDYPDADVLVVFDHSNIDVEPSGLSHMENHQLVKVLTEQGAVRASFQRLNYDPATQSITVRRIIVHRADGTIENIDLNGLVDVIAPAHAIYWGARMLGLDLPRLHPGDAVEIETYRKGFQIAYLTEGEGITFGQADDESIFIPPMRGHFYDVVLFQATDPIVEKTYTLRTPRAMPVQYSVHNGEVVSEHTFDTESFTYVFSRRDVPAAKREWRSSGLSDYAPKVVMATVMDWGEKSRWFNEVNESQFDTTPEISAKVTEITQGLKTDDAKISAINHWVAQNIRYCGFNMGKGEGYTLHPGDMVYRERAGVCKDIAGMSITMLRAAGYTVYPAMTMAGARVEKTPADQFNHCVVALKQDDGYKMLDPTWVPFSRYDWSRSEGEQNYVVGSPEGEGLSIIRTYTPEENGLVMEISARIDDKGTLRGKLSLDPSGNSDSRLRRAFGNTPRDQIEPNLRRWLAALAPNAELLEYKFADPENWEKALTLSVEFEVTGYATIGKETMTWLPLGSRLVMANFAGMFSWANSHLPEERETPALIWANSAVRLTETIEIPKGFNAVAPVAQIKSGCPDGAGYCDFTWQAEGRKLVLDGRMVASDRTITVDRWADFRTAVTSFHEIGETPLVASKKGDRS